MSYSLEGRLLEVCNCDAICPCWIGEDPDYGTCATADQQDALLSVWSGKLGGPVADLAGLIGEVVAVERVPITFNVEGGKGRIQLGNLGEAELAPYQGATGKTTALTDTVFSTIPGSPAYVGKAASFQLTAPHYGFNLTLSGHNAVQGHFKFEA